MSAPLRSRRRFLASAAATAAAPMILDPRVWADDRRGHGPNGRINLGFIGIGMMGRGHLGAFLGNRDVQVVAVCDVHKARLDDSVERVHRAYAEQRKSGAYRGCAAFNDFRELLARENDIVFQTGSQQRTEFNGHFRKAVEYIRSGRIGKLRTIRIGVGGPARPCDLPAERVPEGVDWNLWNGPSPAREYNVILCPAGIHNHFPAWRNYREYAGGGLSDMGAHHFDIAQWAMDMDHSGPTEIIPPETGEMGLKFVYANGVEMFHGGPSGCTFEGTDGTITVDRPFCRSNPASILETPLGDRDFHLPNVGTNHRQNWIDCIKTRRRPVADVEIGARTNTVCQLGNIGYQLRRRLRWNPEREEFVDDMAANRLRSRENRAPWDRA